MNDGTAAEHDSPDLEALFDSIVAASAAPAAAEGEAIHGASGMQPAEVLTKIGKLTRTLHQSLRELGFDSVTHYVLLPDWKGPFAQDYREYSQLRAGQWASFCERSGLPYMPSVAPGWDASARGADFGLQRPDKYPWWPVVTGEHPEHFAAALARARAFRSPVGVDDPLLLIASLNEWSEGHYLEPDQRFGHGWLEAVRSSS